MVTADALGLLQGLGGEEHGWYTSYICHIYAVYAIHVIHGDTR
jgi:hypothetical protein